MTSAHSGPVQLVILPVHHFGGMSRLSSVLDPGQRSKLSRNLCDRAVSAVQAAGLDIVVVSSSPDVAEWAGAAGIETSPDPGAGLSAAAHSVVTRLGDRPWMLLHADLPLITAAEVTRVAETAIDTTVLVPSLDGGTNAIASKGAFPFAYGPGSFHRHFASAPEATIISSTALSIDIDTPAQLRNFPNLTEVSSLTP